MMRQEQRKKVLHNLDGYVIEGDKRYAYHPEKGCMLAPSFILQDAMDIMGIQKQKIASLEAELAEIKDDLHHAGIERNLRT